MDALEHYSIPVSGLQNGPHEYDFDVDRTFFECFPESPIKDGKVAVHFIFDKRPDMYTMSFEIQGTVHTTCDRCLEAFDLPIEDEEILIVKFDEKEWEEADIIYILKGTEKLNVAKYIYEFINLAVPIAKTHDDADEECDPEMMKFLKANQIEDVPEEGSSTSIWDALKGLQNDN
ncbi:MAG: DUF177 domain-containing protein [Saprospiraceae bacterium]|nr:DUF177 domain-containing protein [Saprospiraceae bacterium]